MGFRDWWKSVKQKLGFGSKQGKLNIAGLDPQNENFEINILNELGIDDEFYSKEPVKEILLEKIRNMAIEKGLITEEQSIQNIKSTEEVIALLNEIKKSDEISIKDDEITVWNKKDEVLTCAEYFQKDKSNEIYHRSISAIEHPTKGGKKVTYDINEYTYGDVMDRAKGTKYDEIEERYTDYSQQIKDNSEESFKKMLYSDLHVEVGEFKKEEKNDYYSVEIKDRINDELRPDAQSKEQLQINMLIEIGVPEQLLQSKTVRNACISQLGNIEELKTQKDVENRIDEIKNNGTIMTNNNGVLITNDSSNDSHNYTETTLFAIGKDEFNRPQVYRRTISADQYFNEKNQVEVKYNLQDSKIKLSEANKDTKSYRQFYLGEQYTSDDDISQENIKIGNLKISDSDDIEKTNEIDKTEIIFNPKEYNRTEENIQKIIDLDTSKEQNQEGKTSAEKFRETLHENYEKQQKKTIDIFEGLKISENLLEDPQTYASLQDSLLAELSREQIDLENQDTDQIVATLKDNMSWQIDENRVLIYNNDSENGRYGAVEFAALDDGKIQKSNLLIRETNINGEYEYDFSSNSTITQNGKPVKNIEKTNHETSQNKLPKDKIMISLNSLTSLPQSEWQQIAENNQVQNNLNKEETRNA